MDIQFTSLKRNYELYKDEYDHAVSEAVQSGWYILGPRLEAFENAFAEWMGVKHCVGVNSGTDALILGIRALGIGPGDEVIVPAGTYIASVLGITENGATPVYVDSNEYLVMDESQIEDKITANTKAILAVHMYGQACNMRIIAEVAHQHGLYLIEDCAQCHGATWEDQKTGTFGDLGCFSFYPTKPLGAFGDAGCVVTGSDCLAERLRMLRNYGSKVKYHNESIGVNSRLDEIQASVLQVGLRHLDETNRMRNCVAERFMQEITNKKVRLPQVRAGASHVFHLFPVLVEDQYGFREYLNAKGIQTQIHYPIPPYLAECYKNQDHHPEDYPKAYEISMHEVSLPIYAGIGEEAVDSIIKAVNEYT